MKLKRILAAVVIMVLTISPALAANCVSACVDHNKPAVTEMAAMDGMSDCHHDHQSSPEKKHAPSHDQCTKAGCHSISTAAFLLVTSRQFKNPPSNAHPNFVSVAISADLPPPIKPPA